MRLLIRGEVVLRSCVELDHCSSKGFCHAPKRWDAAQHCTVEGTVDLFETLGSREVN